MEDMSGNTRKNQVTRLVTLRHRSTMSGALRPWDLAVCRHVLAIDADEFEEGVDGGFEGTGVALDLGEEEAALQCGEEGDSEVVRVGAVREVPSVVKRRSPSLIAADHCPNPAAISARACASVSASCPAEVGAISVVSA